MAACNFVRKNCSGYEYGVIRLNNSGTKHETRIYEVQGKAATMDEALAANAMVLKGLPKSGRQYVDIRPAYK